MAAQRIMTRRSIGREFLSLGKYDALSLVSLHLRRRELIKDVVDMLDNCYYQYREARAFFAYELVGDKREGELLFEVVMGDRPEGLARIFMEIKFCIVVRIESIKVVNLYNHLLSSCFRVYNALLFQRLRARQSEVLALARNPLTRMVWIDRNLLSLTSLEYEQAALLDLQGEIRSSRENKTEETLFSEQIVLQKEMFGKSLWEQQVHVPSQSKAAILLRVRERVRKESEMRDCQEQQCKLVPEQQQLNLLVSALQLGLNMCNFE